MGKGSHGFSGKASLFLYGNPKWNKSLKVFQKSWKEVSGILEGKTKKKK